MSQSFLNGYRANMGMGVGDVRNPYMRSADQNMGYSGNPGGSYNMPNFNQQGPAGISQPSAYNSAPMGGVAQTMPSGAPTQAQLYAAQQAATNSQNYGGPQYNSSGSGGVPPAVQQYIQPQLNRMQQYTQPGLGGQQPMTAPAFSNGPSNYVQPNFGGQPQTMQSPAMPNGYVSPQGPAPQTMSAQPRQSIVSMY